MMEKIIVCVIFLISFTNAIQCYNGKTYVDIPESKLFDLGYTKYNITHSNFDCKMAYKRYLKVKEIEPANVSNVIQHEKNELEEPSKIGSFLPIFLLAIIVAVIWLIKNVVQKEPQDENYIVVEKEPINQKNDSVTKESVTWDDISREYSEPLRTAEHERHKNHPVKSWDDLSKEYSENLRKIEHERQKPYPVNPVQNPVNPVQKSDKTYEELLTEQEWYNFRKKVIYDRGRYACEFCKKKHNLHVHHKFYYKTPDKEKIEPWLYNMDEVLLLCENCHKSVHEQNKIRVYYMSYADYNNRKVVFYNDFRWSYPHLERL